MKIKGFLLLSFMVSFLSSCLLDGASDTITGDYETIWIDIPQKRSINKGERIISAFV